MILEAKYTTTNNTKDLIPQKTNKTSNIEMEIHGVANLESPDGRPYSMSNVCDFVSILIVNGYAVLIESPSAQEYIVTYGYTKGDCYERP